MQKYEFCFTFAENCSLMKSILRISVFFLLLGLAQVSKAQALPTFGVSHEVTRGKLAGGLEYYLVPNASSKGYADFALVQLHASPDLRAALTALPHFHGRSPYRFLAENGIGYGRNGYIDFFGEAAAVRLSGVPVYRSEVADSVFLMLLDIASFNPDRQAVMVCGDIDVKTTLRTLSCLSLIVPPRSSALPHSAVPPDDGVSYGLSLVPRGNSVSELCLDFTSARLPFEKMNTPVPFILRFYAGTLSVMLEDRIRSAFKSEGIPLAGLHFRYRDSSDSPYDERYSIRLKVPSELEEKASTTLTAVISSLCEYGAGIPEYEDAASICLAGQSRHKMTGFIPNSYYLRRCMAWYMFGSALASRSDVEAFFSRRVIDPAIATGLFNNFMRELLTPALDGSPDRQVYVYQRPDTSALSMGISRVLRVGDSSEPVSGGRLWTYSNGIKVVYRKNSSDKRFRYALMLKGGYDKVPELKAGEGPFTGDMILDPELVKILRVNGISIKSEVSPADLRISGDAPSSKLHLLFKALLDIPHRSGVGEDGFEYFKSCEALETAAARDAGYVSDSLAVAPYLYMERKEAANLDASLIPRVNKYLQQRFRSVNDGLLVLTGDLDEQALNKFLCKYLGNFNNGIRRERRLSFTIPLRSGTSACTMKAAEGETPSSTVTIYARMTLNRERYMAFRVASVALEKELVRSLAEKGLYCDFNSEVSVLPEDIVKLTVTCRPCTASGLPEAVAPDGAGGAAAAAVRDALSRLLSGSMGKADLAAYKAALVKKTESSLADPDFLISSLLSRHSLGKDFVSDYKTVIGAVDQTDVKEVLQALSSGCRIECDVL